MMYNKFLPVYLLLVSHLSSAMNFSPMRKSTKKKQSNHQSIERPVESDSYEPGKKYREPDLISLYEYLDVEAFRNEIKEIEEQYKEKEQKNSWYKRVLTLLIPICIQEMK